MSSLDNIFPSDRSKFELSGEFPGWLSFVPKRESYLEDLEVLNKYKDLKIIVTLHLRSNYTPWGFHQDDLLMIEGLLDFQGLNISAHFENLSLIQAKRNLKLLCIFDYVNSEYGPTPEIHLNLRALQNLSLFRPPVLANKKSKIDFGSCNSLKVLFLSSLSEKEDRVLSDLHNLPNLQYLSLHRPTFSSFGCLRGVPQLNMLEVDYARNLNDVSGLRDWKNIELIDFHNCPNIDDVESLKSAKRLRFLRFWGSRKLKSLSCLSGLKIECLDFFESNILDGDLSFIETLNELQYLRFSNKRHFNRKLSNFLELSGVRTSSPSVWSEHCDNALSSII